MRKILWGVALLLWCVSWPLEWMEIFSSPVQGEMSLMERIFKGYSAEGAQGFSVLINGGNGVITFGIRWPIWFLLALGLLGCVTGGSHRLGIKTFPEWAYLGPLVISGVHIVLGFMGVCRSTTSTWGPGFPVAIIAVVLSFFIIYQGRGAEPKPLH